MKNLIDSHDILVVTGPESSGKSTLVSSIASTYGLPTVGEYARSYLDQLGTSYVWEDLVTIGKCQCLQEAAAHRRYPHIICDTDIITIDIWSKEKFGKSIGIPNQFIDSKHYLLCAPNIPWVADPQRENPIDRHRLFDVYHDYLVQNKLSFSVYKADRRF